MHELVRNQLEELLSGRLTGHARQSVEEHLSACAPCRETLQDMRQHSRTLASLRAPAALDPSPGFYSRVLQSIEEQSRPSFWNLLLDPMFGRRLVYATLSLTVLLGALLLITQPEPVELAQSPVEVMAVSEKQPPAAAAAEWGNDMQQDRQVFLVTLASASD